MAPESDSVPDAASLGLLEDALRKTMLSTSGAELDAALADLGWADMLSEVPDLAIPLVFRLLGETGSHASVLNDVLLETIGGLPGGTPPMPYAGGSLGGVGTRRGERRYGESPSQSGRREPDARWAAAAAGARRRTDADVRGPPRTGLVAGRLGQGDADTCPPACAGPSAVRQADCVLPGGPAPAGRDAGGHRRRRGATPSPARDLQPRTHLDAGQGRRRKCRADRRQTLPAGAGRH